MKKHKSRSRSRSKDKKKHKHHKSGKHNEEVESKDWRKDKID